MPLIHNTLESLYNGVNQQAAEHRLPTQVEEMINCLPTLDRGLRKRNPTKDIPLVHRSDGSAYTLDTSLEAWHYAYDRGIAGTGEEKYKVLINTNGLRVIDVNSGVVYEYGDGIVMSSAARQYLYPFAGSNGYSAVTIKDTTFIVNRNVAPRMLKTTSVEEDGTTLIDVVTATIPLVGGPTNLLAGLAAGTTKYKTWQENTFRQFKYITGCFWGASTDIIVDGHVINFTQPDVFFDKPVLTLDDLRPPVPSYDSWVTNIVEALQNGLDGSVYQLSVAADNASISIKKLGSATISIVINMSLKPPGVTSCDTGERGGWTEMGSYVSGSSKSDYFGTVSSVATQEYHYTPTSLYGKTGYVWIMRSDATYGFDYTMSLIAYNTDGTIYQSETFSVTGASGQTTHTVAEDLADAVNASVTTDFSADFSGSQILIWHDDSKDIGIQMSDSYGNSASYAWIKEVATMSDLPKSFEFTSCIVKITGVEDTGFGAYWVKWDGEQWVESIDPAIQYTQLDPTTMPHVLSRTPDGMFMLDSYGGWVANAIGDETTNPNPSFIAEDEGENATIRDVFFFKNRLGLITKNTVIMSEVGEYGNFYRRTVLSLLDSDPIDTTVDSTKVINIEYAIQLSDQIVFFGDKQQFKMTGGAILSPSSVSISNSSNYEFNRRVRPVAINDRIFFCANRGNYMAVVEYFISATNDVAIGNDITAHCQSYIPDTITTLTASPINNMLLLCGNDNAVYCYKYYDRGNERVQSAWFKWQFNGDVSSVVILGDNLYLSVARYGAEAAENWILAGGVWNDENIWDDAAVWQDDLGVPDYRFEKMSLFPEEHLQTFKDPDDTLIHSEVVLGEWVLSRMGQKEIRGHLQFKTVQITSEDGSDFSLVIYHKDRDLLRSVPSEYTVNKKPMVGGKANNIEVRIVNWSEIGFQINSISYEGNYNVRSRRL